MEIETKMDFWKLRSVISIEKHISLYNCVSIVFAVTKLDHARESEEVIIYSFQGEMAASLTI